MYITRCVLSCEYTYARCTRAHTHTRTHAHAHIHTHTQHTHTTHTHNTHTHTQHTHTPHTHTHICIVTYTHARHVYTYLCTYIIHCVTTGLHFVSQDGIAFVALNVVILKIICQIYMSSYNIGQAMAWLAWVIPPAVL